MSKDNLPIEANTSFMRKARSLVSVVKLTRKVTQLKFEIKELEKELRDCKKVHKQEKEAFGQMIMQLADGTTDVDTINLDDFLGD